MKILFINYVISVLFTGLLFILFVIIYKMMDIVFQFTKTQSNIILLCVLIVVGIAFIFMGMNEY